MVTVTNETKALVKDLPPVLSGEQVRQFLHIGKRRCAWLLQNGYIICAISPKRSRRYTVTREDLLAFIDKARKCPEDFEAPFGQFSAAKYQKKPPTSCRYGFPPTLPAGFAVWLNKEFTDVPDALSIPDVIHITGYTDTTIDRWIALGHIKTVQTQSGKIIAKSWLLDFYCGYGYKVSRMSEKHTELMRKYFESM